MPAKYVFDTNIYIRCTHDENFALRYADQYHKLIPFSFFSSVVAHELIVGCTDELAVRRVQRFVEPFERVNRIVNPTYDDWKVAGQIAVTIVVKRTHLKSKKIALLMIS